MMTSDEMKAALAKMNDDAWHAQDLGAAYEIYADDVVFQRVPSPASLRQMIELLPTG